MKKNFLIFGLGLLLFMNSGVSRAAGTFEGEVDYQMTGRSNKVIDMVYLVKGKHLRVNTHVEDSDTVMILDTSTHKAIRNKGVRPIEYSL